jgi:hypothetical protein
MPRDMSMRERQDHIAAQRAAEAARRALKMKVREIIDPRGIGGKEFVDYAVKRAMGSAYQIGGGDHSHERANTPEAQSARIMASAQASAREIAQAETKSNRTRTFGPAIKQPSARLALVAARARAGSLSRGSLPGRQKLRIG